MSNFDEMDRDLEASFAAARRHVPPASSDLMARVLADAEALQPAAPDISGPVRVKLFDRLVEACGGWPALGGLVTATMVGFWIGISPPSVIEEPTASLFEGADALALYDVEFTGFGWDQEER